MQFGVEAGAHGKRSRQRSAQKDEQQQSQDARVLPGRAIGREHIAHS